MNKAFVIFAVAPILMGAQQMSTTVIVDDNASPNHKPEITLLNRDNSSGLEFTMDAVINAVEPNLLGVSLNKFKEFGMGSGYYRKAYMEIKNKHDAGLIIFEVTGDKPSFISAHAVMDGKNADFIFANPNGYISAMTTDNFGWVNYLRDKVILNEWGGFEYHEQKNMDQGMTVFRINKHGPDYAFGINIADNPNQFYRKWPVLNETGEIEMNF